MAMLCEESMTIAKTRNALLVPQNTKQAPPAKTQSNTTKIDKHYTNCGMTNHNVETCKNKKEQTMTATKKVTQPSQKTQKTSM